MKTITKISLFFFLLLLASCEKEGDKIYLSGLEESDFLVTETDVILSKATSTHTVLSLAWTRSTLVISNSDMSAPNVFSAYIQASTTQDFASNVIETAGENESKTYTGAELNTLAKNLGLEPDVATPVYFRMRASMGGNVESAYSEVKEVNITSYFIDMTVAAVLDSEKEPTGFMLASPEANGIYTGFVGATSWSNFFIEESDGLIWGNLPVKNSPFLASSEEGSWNFWYPEPAGCYYTTINTQRANWTAVYVPSLTVAGDIAGEMSFDRAKVQWYYVFNATGTGTATIQVNGEGDEYNYVTGTDAPADVKVPIAFAQNGSNLVLDGIPGNIVVNIPAAGECTLIIDLSDPKNWTCRVISGSGEPEPVRTELYLIGIDDGITNAGWNFDNKISLYNEDDLAYSGVINANSKYGYQVAIEKDNWGDVYMQADGDAYAGTLVFQGENNLPAPAPGLYLFDVSLNNLNYVLTSIGSEIYAVGLDDVWEFNMPLAATSSTGVYSGQITFAGASPWGFQIHLNTEWGPYFGGSDGKLYFKGSNITDDAALSPGTYTLTVDLINQTYTIE